MDEYRRVNFEKFVRLIQDTEVEEFNEEIKERISARS